MENKDFIAYVYYLEVTLPDSKLEHNYSEIKTYKQAVVVTDNEQEQLKWSTYDECYTIDFSGDSNWIKERDGNVLTFSRISFDPNYMEEFKKGAIERAITEVFYSK